jgi:hypothetical protein
MSHIQNPLTKFIAAAASACVIVGAASRTAQAVTTTLSAGADMDFVAGSPAPTDASVYGLVANVFLSDQAVIDFPVTGIPSYAKIISVQMGFDETSYANALGVVNVFGDVREGVFTAADLTNLGSSFGSYDSITLGLGENSIDLGAKAVLDIQGALASGQDLGVRLASGSSDTNTSIGSIEESPSFTAPTLVVTYSVPEPASVGIFCLSGFLGLNARRRRVLR